MELKGKRAIVIGLAESGRAAVRFLLAVGAEVTATDQKRESELGPALSALAELPVRLLLGDHPETLLSSADFIITSPGVPKDSPFLLAAQRRNIPVLSELELASRFVSAPIIAITGTNGKSTVTSLIGHLLATAWGEEEVFVGGNIGTPFLELPLSGRKVRAAVVEVSSFQLEFVDTFAPRIAIVLNITADHLDRYRDFDEYAACKWRIFARQSAEDLAIVNLDDPETAKRIPSLRSRVYTFSLSVPAAAGMYLKGGELEYRAPGVEPESLPVSEVPLHGRHNLLNVMAAVCAARAMEVPMEVIREGVRSFRGLAHRLELVRELRGVKYYDDSKATNAGSVEAAVMGLSEPVLLLLGGQAKGCSFIELGRRLGGRVRKVFAFGECRAQVEAEVGTALPVTVTETMAEALKLAAAEARPGEAVLLAPACASFDQFQSYKHRGEVFQQLVKELS